MGNSTLLHMIDVSNPSNPVNVGYYNTQTSAYGVTVASGYAYAASSGTGLKIIRTYGVASVSMLNLIVNNGDLSLPFWSQMRDSDHRWRDYYLG